MSDRSERGSETLAGTSKTVVTVLRSSRSHVAPYRSRMLRMGKLSASTRAVNLLTPPASAAMDNALMRNVPRPRFW